MQDAAARARATKRSQKKYNILTYFILSVAKFNFLFELLIDWWNFFNIY